MIDSFRRSVPRFTELLLIVIGCFITAFGLVAFLFPNNLAPGGVGGLALIVNHFLPALSIGNWMLVMNLILFVLAFTILGSHIGTGTLIGTFLLSIFVDILSKFYVHPITNDLLLSVLYGGALTGVGLGLVFKGRATTGGTDIVGFIINKYTGISVGQSIFMADATVVTTMAIVFRSTDVALLAILSIFVSSATVDTVQKGFIRDRVFFIISDKHEDILRSVDQNLGRGATLIQTWGGYQRKERKGLVICVSQSETDEMERIIRTADPDSFYVVVEGVRVVGEGFRSPTWV
jgi:uncharacterized membrane-anchored protein YitT (DUF2179 family)